MTLVIKIILLLMVDGYIGFNGAGRWKLSLLEINFIALIVNFIIILN